jgi:acyl-CoA synthetase (NDP forming)
LADTATYKNNDTAHNRTIFAFQPILAGIFFWRFIQMSEKRKSDHPLEEVLHPKSIAVAGASPTGRGGAFITPLIDMGFKGEIYPVNPKYDEAMGFKCYPRVSDIPGPVDYVISSIPATHILDLIDDCVEKKVKGVHLFTARFSETGRADAAELEQELLRRARAGGVRLIGPNCMGLYHPKMGISFNEGMTTESGKVGLASQSGMVVGEIVGQATARGIRFSKAISYGNALDFNECDYLEYFTQDEETEIIFMYIEGVRDGRRFAESLKKATAVKPVVLLKGGRGNAGTRATASHTASMAGSQKLWQSMVDQAGAISVTDIDELVDVGVGLYFAPNLNGRRVGVAGGSGGSSVQAADQCEEAGLDVIALPEDIREELKAANNPIWDWINNPADFSISMEDASGAGAVTALMAKHPDFDMMILFVNGPWRKTDEPFDIEKHMSYFDIKKITDKPVITVFGKRPGRGGKDHQWFTDTANEVEEALMEKGYPVYPGVGRASRALAKIMDMKERKEKR